jgi:hypothetical protein
MSDTIQTVSWSLNNGAAGHLYLPPGRERPNDVLWESIDRTGIEAELKSAFRITDPLWYGLWMDSPLTPIQSRVLHTMFSDVVASVPRYASYLQAFLQAVKVAADTSKQLAVELSPPGHVDMGWITTFVHCPQCKAEGPVERWQETYPAAPIECPVCGHSYPPAETYSSEREYYAERATCGECGESYRVKDLSKDEITILEDQHAFREACEEIAWLWRVAAFYRRHPDQEERIKPHFLRVIEANDDERVKRALMDGVPFNEIELPPDDALSHLDSRSWSAEDHKVIEYLQHYHFSLPQRLAFVEKRIAELQPVIGVRVVSCLKCGGRLQ